MSHEENGWVIVRYVMGGIMYWTGESVDHRGFMPDNRKACRFVRQQDGYTVLVWLLGGIGNVEEHAWVTPQSNGETA